MRADPWTSARKAHRIRERLGYSGSIDGPFPPKPKGNALGNLSAARSRGRALATIVGS
jgi:hypothetical protein